MKRRTFLATASASVLGLSGRTQASGTSSPTASPEPTGTDTADSSDVTSRDDLPRSPPADEALEIGSSNAVEGTNVNVGASGTAKNTTGHWLGNCLIEVTGAVGGRTRRARATMDPLAPNRDWEWTVAFWGDVSADTVERLSVETRADSVVSG